MSESIKLTLPLPPSSNRYWRKSRTGRVYLSAEAIDYRDAIGYETLQVNPLCGDLSVTARFYRARKSGDLDNRLKILFDAMQGNCYKDDKQIIEIHAYRFDDKTSPRVEVEITQI